MGGEERVLVATWGNPFGWFETTYRVDCGEFDIKDCRNSKVVSRSSLPVLIDALKPDRVLIITADTLVNMRSRDGSEPPFEDVRPSAYDEVLEDVRNRVRWWINERAKELEEHGVNPETIETFRNAEIFVAPGLGDFPNAAVSGDLLDFYGSLLHRLAEWLPEGNSEVILDITHGINFMPVLTYRALTNLLGLSAYLNRVQFVVVDSEPVPLDGGEKSGRAMAIRVMENTEVLPKPIYSTIRGHDEWSAFISSVTNGFPLVFVLSYPEIGDVRDYLQEKLRTFERGISVSFRDKVIVRRNQPLTADFRTASKLLYLLRVLDAGGMGNYRSRAALTLKKLEEIVEKLFAELPRIGPVVCIQIENIKNNADDDRMLSRLSGGSAPLGTIMQGNFRESRVAPNPDNVKHLRNFIAHSGFEYNITMLSVEKGANSGNFMEKMKLYYTDDDLAFRFAINALKRLDFCETEEKMGKNARARR